MSQASGPPPERRILEIHRRQGGPRPAVGERGGPASWERAGEGVAGARPAFEDAEWSLLYQDDTRYARAGDGAGEIPPPSGVQGPMLNAPVWTWEVPVYFWLGGLSSGASFVALAADLAGDERSAVILRRLALGSVVPCAPLLIMDLGRPGRFLNMMRIFKPRSPMSMGAWCLLAYSNAAAGAVTADLLGRRRAAKRLGGAGAVLGTYLGSYTGALLAATAVPVWGRSRLLLGPIFVCTAVASGAAASRLVLAATGTPVGHPTRNALGTIETGAMTMELVLAHLNRKRLGRLGEVLEHGRAGRMFRVAEGLVVTGLSLRAARRRGGPRVHHLASLLYLLAGLAFRFAWIEGGKASARDDEAVARMARTPPGDLRREQA